jgi:predicted ATPase
MPCSKCGSDNPAGKKFCGDCGAPLADRPLSAQGGIQPNGGATREREAAFHDAITIARWRQAKSFELRATTSLARLLAEQGHRDEARAMLAEICGWFTEGFNTTDVKEARSLLNELGA